MSTLTSSDLGELKRPTTRVHAPPGGGSSWGFGNDATESPFPVDKRRNVQNSPRQKPNPFAPSPSNTFANAPPQPTVQQQPPQQPTPQQQTPQQPPQPARQQLQQPPPAPAPAGFHQPQVQPPAPIATSFAPGSIRVALVKTKTDAEIVNGMAHNCLERLKLNRAIAPEEFVVARVDELPYAANKLTLEGGFDGVICFGYLNTTDPLFVSVSNCLTQSFIDISVKNVKPVIRGLFAGEARTAVARIKTGLGSELAEDIEQLVRLGGFGARTVAVSHNAFHAENKAAKISKGNVLPPQVTQAPFTVANSLQLLRNALFQHGARGIAGFGRKFRIIDDDGNKSLSRMEFAKALKELTLELPDKDAEELFRFIDHDNSGGIDFDEFLLAIRGQLNERRTQMVLAAFNILDADRNGVIELNDIMAKYSADSHPDVLAGKKTKAEVMREFLDTFDGGEKDGKVHPNEFLRYYSNVSASIDDDDYFELMIRNAWHISGGEGWCANTTCRRVLVTHPDGHQSVEEIRNDIGIAASNTQTIQANLKSQGLESMEVEASGYLDTTKPRTGPGFEPKYAQKKKQYGAGESSIVFG